MVSKTEEIMWFCDICSKIYFTKREAEDCERQCKANEKESGDM